MEVIGVVPGNVLRWLRDWMPHWTRHWAADSGLLFLSQLAALVATSVLAIMLARTLGPSEWGIFSGLLALGLAFSIFVDFGVATWLLRELSRLWVSEEEARDDIRARAGRLVMGSLMLNACLGAALLIATVVVSETMRLEGSLTFALACLMGYAALLAASSALEALFRSRRRLRRVMAAMLLEKTLLLLLVAAAVVAGLGIPGIALMYAIAGAARFAFNGTNVVLKEDLVLRGPRLEDLRRVIGQSMPFALSAASLNIFPRLDTFLIASLSATAAGYFAIGDRVVGPALIIPAVVGSTLFPFLASEPGRSSAARKIVLMLFLMGGGLAALGAVCAPFVVPALFGTDYRSAVRVVQVMLLVLPFVYASSPLLTQLYASGRERSVLAATISVSCIGTVTIVAGQLALGPLGAATGYLIRQILLLLALIVVPLVPLRLRRRETDTNGEAQAPSIPVGNSAHSYSGGRQGSTFGL
jgi:O-antigen/teichoic acid export membrane protein